MRGTLLWSVSSSCNTKEQEAEFCRTLHAVVWWVGCGWLAEGAQLLAPFLNRQGENNIKSWTVQIDGGIAWQLLS